MPLPVPTLDDRRFQDFVDEAKRAIPRHCPEWTNHNLNDPGVALIELFAWMSEQVIYRLNQVPDRLYLQFLNLLGIEPFAPGVASTDLTFWLSDVLDHEVRVPAGSQVATMAGTGDAVVFSTVRELVITPPVLAHTLSVTADPDARDLLPILRSGVAVDCFGPDPVEGDALYLGFTEPLPGTALRLNITAQAAGMGIHPDRPPILWQAWTGQEWTPVTVHRDSTGGLNRPGELILLMPGAHVARAVGGRTASWVRVVLQDPDPGEPGYTRPPRISSLTASAVGGTVPAQHVELVEAEVLGRSDGGPGQVLRTSRRPVAPRRPGEEVTVTGATGTDVWTEVADFTRSGAQDKHYVWEGASGEIRFGPSVRQPDGSVRRHGAAPLEGSLIGVTGYRVGGGAAGNVGARTLVAPRSPLPYITTVSNLRAATGGSDPETVDEVKVRGPLTLRTGRRAVTAADFEQLSLESSPRLARARCAVPETDGGPVRLLLVPRRPPAPGLRNVDEFALEEELLEEVTAGLEPRRLVGSRIELTTPYYIGVAVEVSVRAATGHSAAAVRQTAEETLRTWLDPLHGGADRSGWPFDRHLTGSAVVHRLEGLAGVANIEDVRLYEYDLRRGERVGPVRDVLTLDADSLFLPGELMVVAR
ncbi:putative baseplate assembly protein [Kineosporia sp. NBRC 101731]|uniref:putative baseplate assembly protein n=1 Tax=Kineosporia sp. NBRC 101731 TaxID=3032199 RepID=UPI0024A2117B|nr:putative baseplate assembly protein [Kineosporia sp. NBRC 101731]GLY29479.1 putative baseplate assembly protein [Kineosporia sp. NBRC 101731]